MPPGKDARVLYFWYDNNCLIQTPTSPLMMSVIAPAKQQHHLNMQTSKFREADIAAIEGRSKGLVMMVQSQVTIESKTSDLYTRIFEQFDSNLDSGELHNLHTKLILHAFGPVPTTAGAIRD